MNVVYILFRKNDTPFEAPFIVGVYEKEEDAYERKEQMFKPDEYFIEEIQKIAKQTGFPLKNLCLELNSSCRLLNMDFLKSIIFALRLKDIKIVLNDFGSGLASIDFLRELSPEYIKFNKKYSYEFYKFENRMIVRCLSELAAALGTKVLIEGVDNQHIRDELKSFPIDNFQGNFYSPELSLSEILNKI